MNCRQFRRQHDAYVDDTLSGVELDGMANHLRFCETCEQQDTRVRRALLLARNLPQIHPSPAFGERLQTRLVAERALIHASQRSAHFSGRDDAMGFPQRRTTHGYAAMAALLLAGAGLAGAAAFQDTRDAGDDTIRLSPVVAYLPEIEPSPLTTPTMVAAMPAGMPLWPAVFVAQQASWHLASDAAAH